MNMRRFFAVAALLLGTIGAVGAQPYWNNLEVYRLNKVQPHDRVMPDGEQWRMSLNGTWRFAFFDSPERATLTPPRWDSIRVPGNMELQGYGVPVYVNMKNEFASNPPYAPTDYNPVGVYARRFTLPPSWQGRRTIVKFGAVASAMYLYVGGREVGYSQDSKTPAEWDITRYLVPGENEIKVKVVRWCDGSYLECQDMWRMSGITRDVELYSVPTTHITDLKIVADLDTTDWRTGRLDVMVDLSREVSAGSVEMELTELGIRARQPLVSHDWFVSLRPEVGEVEPWTDSTPRLYTLVVRLMDARGNETERLTKRIGFRHVDIRGGQLRLNGQPMEIRGVNRHEHSMQGGHYVSPDEMRRDVAMMKEMGINAVRTCHYPDDELWYDLCDSAGLYVWDEANVESHAQGYGEHSLAKKREWLNPILDRVYNMYKRDRNHPSVVVWSLGNECGNGYCFEEAYRFLKGKDNTRPVSYERAELDWNTDIVGVMYPSVQFLSEYARNPKNRRPYIMVEYCHAMGNSMGGLQDYWDTIDKYPQLQGGFVWDWMDQAFWVDGCWAVGGDMGELPGIKDDDNFCANGILAADATPHPCAAEVEAVYTRGRGNVAGGTAERQLIPCGLDYDIKCTTSRHRTRIGNKEFTLEVNMDDGSVERFTYHGRELLAAPLRWHFWRPPTDNDLADPRGARAWQGLDGLRPELVADEQVVSRRGRGGDLELHLLYRLRTPDGAAMMLRQLVEVNPAGQVQLSYQLVPGGAVNYLPMVGIQFGLDTAAYDACTFYGNIHEIYADRRAAQRVSTWYKPLSALSAPQYVVPQEQGRREARWVRFGSGEGSLTIASPAGQEPMGFSVRRWPDSTLTAARRWCQVGDPDPYYTVTVDHRAAGLGTATCGPGVADRFLLRGDSCYTYRFLLDPTGAASSADAFPMNPSLGQAPAIADDSRGLGVASVAMQPEASAPYNVDAGGLLADGRRAVVGDWAHGWAGFCGRDTVCLTFTLDEYTDLGQVRASCAHSPADWVVMPIEVQAQWSIDGVRWSDWHDMAPAGQDGGRAGMVSRRQTYAISPRRARSVHYVRLRFVAQPLLPVWHPYAGQPSWLMIDEVTFSR